MRTCSPTRKASTVLNHVMPLWRSFTGYRNRAPSFRFRFSASFSLCSSARAEGRAAMPVMLCSVGAIRSRCRNLTGRHAGSGRSRDRPSTGDMGCSHPLGCVAIGMPPAFVRGPSCRLHLGRCDGGQSFRLATTRPAPCSPGGGQTMIVAGQEARRVPAEKTPLRFRQLISP